MSDIHCGKQTKLSKTIGSPLDTMGEIIISLYPNRGTLSLLDKLLFLFNQLRKETCSLAEIFLIEH